LVHGAGGHLVAIDNDEFGVRGSFDLESFSFPADPSVHRPDSRPFQQHVTRRTGSEQDGVVAGQFDELHPTLSIVNFKSGHESGTRFKSRWEQQVLDRAGRSRSPQCLLCHHLEVVSTPLGHNPEPGDTNLGWASPSMPDFKLSEALLRLWRV